MRNSNVEIFAQVCRDILGKPREVCNSGISLIKKSDCKFKLPTNNFKAKRILEVESKTLEGSTFYFYIFEVYFGSLPYYVLGYFDTLSLSYDSASVDFVQVIANGKDTNGLYQKALDMSIDFFTKLKD